MKWFFLLFFGWCCLPPPLSSFWWLHSHPFLVWCCFLLLGGAVSSSVLLGGSALLLILLWGGGDFSSPRSIWVVLLGLLLLLVLPSSSFGCCFLPPVGWRCFLCCFLPCPLAGGATLGGACVLPSPRFFRVLLLSSRPSLGCCLLSPTPLWVVAFSPFLLLGGVFLYFSLQLFRVVTTPELCSQTGWCSAFLGWAR